MGDRQKRPSVRRISLLVGALMLVVASAVMVAAASAKPTAKAQSIQVGLITKDVTNPFFVKMKQGATREAKRLGAGLKYAAGKSSSDNASQIAAIENMTTAGVKGILITVADAKAENAAIARAFGIETGTSRLNAVAPAITRTPGVRSTDMAYIPVKCMPLTATPTGCAE